MNDQQHKRNVRHPSTIQKMHTRRSARFGGVENARRVFRTMSQQERIEFWLLLVAEDNQ